jgi:hypothetical protein
MKRRYGLFFGGGWRAALNPDGLDFLSVGKVKPAEAADRACFSRPENV